MAHTALFNRTAASIQPATFSSASWTPMWRATRCWTCSACLRPWADGVPEEHLDVPTVLLDALLDDAAARGLYDEGGARSARKFLRRASWAR